MFYLTSKFHGNRVNTFGFMEGGAFEAPPPAQERQKSPGGIGLIKKKSSNHLKRLFLLHGQNTQVLVLKIFRNIWKL